MCEYSKLDEESQAALSAELLACAAAVGGKSYFQSAKPTDLFSKKYALAYPHGTIH